MPLPVRWVELSVQAPREFVEPLSQILLRYGQGGVAVEFPGGFNPDEGEAPDDRLAVVRAYVPVDERLQERIALIDIGVSLVSHLGPVSPLVQRVLDEEEWQEAWKDHFHVLPVGRGIVVVPTWRQYVPSGSQVVICLDPGMAFGTGHHPTTRMCLEELEELVGSGMRVLDVGCGSGILAIAAAKLGARSVLALDIDPVAVQVAEGNVRLNGVEGTVRVALGSLPLQGALVEGYDLVVANISDRVVCQLAGELAITAGPGGVVLVSGLLSDRRDEVARRLVEGGLRVLRGRHDGDWVTLVTGR